MVKTISLLTRRDGMTLEQFVTHWFEIHAPLAHAVPGLRRYVQSHILAERTRPDIPTTDVAIDGIAELWYDDRDAMARALASPEAKTLPTARASSAGSKPTSSRNGSSSGEALAPRARRSGLPRCLGHKGTQQWPKGFATALGALDRTLVVFAKRQDQLDFAFAFLAMVLVHRHR